MEASRYDLIIIGAGIYGIQAVRTYLEIHPRANVICLEADDGIGGVWSKQRYYDGFWTQISHGCCEFSDRRMRAPEEGDVRHGLFDAKYVHEYLEEYLDNHVYDGVTLRQRFRCGFRVGKISKVAGLWQVAGNGKGNTSKQEVLMAAKIMVASGNTSIPNVPDIPDHGFKGRVVHIKDYGSRAKEILSGTSKHIAVLGAGKSAADMAFSAAKAGHNVSWIVRKSGHGPGLFAVPKNVGRCQNPTDVVMTRIGGTLSPSHLQTYTWWMWFLHTTWLGRTLLLWIFRQAGRDSFKHAKWGSMQIAKKGYDLLRPDSDGFVLDAPIGFIQDPSFWPIIAERVQVYREDIDHLSSNGIHLADKDNIVVPCDFLLLGTGFKSEFPFFDAEEHRRLDLSHLQVDKDEEAVWRRLTAEADRDVVRRYPLLAKRVGYPKSQKTTPMRLYNAIGPIQDRSIAFLGCISLTSHFAGAEWQALWATAWIDQSPLLQVPDIEGMRRRIAYDNQWSRRRYPYSSEVSGTTYDLECIPYGDRLMRELGLTSHVEGKNWLQFWTTINQQHEYAGLVSEYITKLTAMSSQ